MCGLHAGRYSVLLACCSFCGVMNSKTKRRKCRHCGKTFTPDYRNHSRQHYCSRQECKCASKAATQHKWLRKPENLTHFRGDHAKANTQAWRLKNPGYWRKKDSKQNVDQKPVPHTLKPKQESHNASPLQGCALQEACLMKSPLFIGILSTITGSTLQDDIAAAAAGLITRGRKILGLKLPDANGSPNATDNDKHIAENGSSSDEALET